MKLPDELTKNPYWICWKGEERNGKIVKIPIAPWSTGHDGPASVTNADNYTTFDEVLKTARKKQYGIGFVFTDKNPFVGIDFDHCIEGENISNEVTDWISRFDSYTEMSPSKKGVHVLIKGTLPKAIRNEKHGVEAYSNGRFFTITGDVSKKTPMEIKESQSSLNELIERYGGETEWDIKPVFEKAPREGEKEHSDDWAVRLATWLRRKGYNEEDALETLIMWWRTSPSYKNDASAKPWLKRKIESAYSPETPYGYWFKQEPRKYEIGENLQLKKHHYPFVIEKEDSNGNVRQSINTGLLADYILCNGAVFKTFNDTSEIMVYNRGVYVDGEKRVESEAQGLVVEAVGSGMVKNIQTNEVIGYTRRATYVERNIFEQDPNIIACETGVLNTETGEFMEHDPDYNMLSKIPVIYNPALDCPRWKKFLSEVLYTEDIPLLQEIFGDCLQKTYKYKKITMLEGGGDNGKSVVLNVLSAFLGEDNICSVPIQVLGKDKFATSSLYGKLANIVGDLPPTTITNTGEFKKSTGRDTLHAQKKHRDEFNFRNYAKHILAANQIPENSDDDTEAFWGRWNLITFPNNFPPGDPRRDENLLDKLIIDDELSGILNWALEGLKRLRENRVFSNTKSAIDTRQVMKRKSNPVNAFVEDCVVTEKNVQIVKKELYAHYTEYMSVEKLGHPLASNMFTQRIKQAIPGLTEGHPRINGRQTWVWYDVQFDKNKSIEKVDEKVVQVSFLEPVPKTDGIGGTDSIGEEKNKKEGLVQVGIDEPVPRDPSVQKDTLSHRDGTDGTGSFNIIAREKDSIINNSKLTSNEPVPFVARGKTPICCLCKEPMEQTVIYESHSFPLCQSHLREKEQDPSFFSHYIIFQEKHQKS